MHTLDKIKNELTLALQIAVGKNIDISEIRYEYPPDKEMGDIAFPCFQLSGKMKTPADEIAIKLKDAINVQMPVLKKRSLITEVKTIGGYLNFVIDKSRLAKKVFAEIEKQRGDYGKSIDGKGQQVMIEFVSPNTNKPLHLGHMRNAFLGVSMIKLFENAGYKVIKTQVINDFGIHIVKSLLAYQKWAGKDDLLKKPSAKTKGDHLVGEYYVKFTNIADKNPDIIKEAKEIMKKWEAGDKKIEKAAAKLNKWAIEGINKTYEKIKISFDKIYLQSQFYKKGKKIVDYGLETHRFYEKEGAIIADLREYNVPEKVVKRSDGTSLYITQDLYLARMKFTDYKISKSIIITGNEQNLYFQQLFAILDILDYPWAKDNIHLNYGMVFLPAGKMKSREGAVVDADNLIRELEVLAKNEIKERDPKIAQKELNKRGETIALAAIKFYFLVYEPNSSVHFDPLESVSFAGKTGPYLLYSNARLKSILRKEKPRQSKKADYTLLADKIEEEIIFDLASFPNIIDEALAKLDPSILARYLFELSQKFNDFYHKLPVLQADAKQKQARLILLNNIGVVLENGLSLLGIDTVEKM